MNVKLTATSKKTHRKGHTFWVGVILLSLIAFSGLFADNISVYDPTEINLNFTRHPPDTNNLLGTDYLGRDVFSRLLHSIFPAYLGGVFSLAIMFFIGTLIGVNSGYIGGKTDYLIMRLMDLWLALPGLLFIILALTFFKPIFGLGSLSVAVAIGLSGIPSYARVVRTWTLYEKNQPYIEALIAMGASSYRIVIWHILPNIAINLISLAATSFGGVVMAAGSVSFILSFIGYNADPNQPELGVLLEEGRIMMNQSWSYILGPMLVLLLTVYGANLLSDGFVERFTTSTQTRSSN